MYKIFALLILVHVSVSTYAKEPLTAKRFVETIQKIKNLMRNVITVILT